MMSMRRVAGVFVFVVMGTAGCATAQLPEPRFIGGDNPNSVLSRMVVAGNTVYLSGVLGSNAGPGLPEQTHQIMSNIRDSLAEVGGTMDDVVKCTIFMADLSQRPQFNEIYRTYFPNSKPARSAVGVDLGGPLVEVECIAVLPES